MHPKAGNIVSIFIFAYLCKMSVVYMTFTSYIIDLSQ